MSEGNSGPENAEAVGWATRFARDRDRVLYSPYLRRLAGVTQVVHAGEGAAFHNRLTHTLKVAQVGRRLAEFLIRQQPDEAATLGVDPDVVETACLVHDLGHPPFGHIAEDELNACVDKAGGYGFEGNAQSFRIVTFLDVREVAEASPVHGLDLTRASLNAILKYPWMRGGAGKERRKWGAYEEDRPDFEWARDGVVAKVKSAEAELMDWADDVTYATHDLEDFYCAGLIPFHRLVKDGRERDDFLVSTRARWQKKDTIDPRRTWADAANFTSRAAAFLDNFGNQRNVGAFAYRAFTEPFDGRLVQIAAGRQFTSLLLTTFLNDFNGARPISLSTKSDRQVDIVDEAQFQINLLMSLTEHFVFDDPSLRAQQEGQQLIVRDLFQFFLSAVESNRSTRVPSPFRDLLPWVDQAKTDEHRRARRARLAADIVGRLTEDRAFRLHQRLKGGSPGSVLEPVVV